MHVPVEALEIEKMLQTRDRCPVCGATAHKPQCGYEWTTAYRCERCRVVFLNPYVTHQGMKKIYASPETLGRFFPFCDHYFEDTEKENRGTRTFRVYEQWLSRLADLTPGRKLLDIGCGAGQFLKLAREKGWQAEGLEFDNALEQKLREQGIPVRTGDFFETDLAEESYDVITLWDVFEHFSEPVPALKRLRKFLKPNGYLLLACPKESSSLAWMARKFYQWSGGKIQYPVKVVYLIDHPLFYSPKTLSNLVEIYGFKVKETMLDETDLRRVEFNPVIKFALHALFFFSRFFGWQNRMVLLCSKA